MFKQKIIFTILILMSAARLKGAMDKHAKIYVAGHRGLVGSAIISNLGKKGYINITTRTHAELDLRNQRAVDDFFAAERPEYVFLAAAKVGGIKANSDYPADFIYDNLMIEANVIHAAHKYGAKKLIFLGSSCIYPRMAPQPIKEEYLLCDYLEKTNKSYAIAKIAGIELCQSYNRQHGTNFIACMPTNLYGPHDNFDLVTSHVLPALLRKFYEAKRDSKSEVVLWGSGKPYREFLHVDDCADAVVFLMNSYDGSEIVNVGTGKDVSILELAHLIKDAVGYTGNLVFDRSKPDGTPKKLLNVDRLKNLGWQSSISLKDGLRRTLTWCEKNSLLK